MSSLVRTTGAGSSMLFGDGIGVLGEKSVMTLNGVRVDDSARAGISNFGATVSLVSTQIRCAAFEITGQVFDGHDCTVEDNGDNRCGCPIADRECRLINAELEPPARP